MARNIPEIPYTELIERTQKLARVGDNTLEKIRGVLQDIYIREIPAKFDWNFLMVSSSFTTVDEYHTNSVSMNTGDTTVQGVAGEAWTSAMVGRKFKPSGNDQAYDVTAFTNASTLTITPALQGPMNLSGAAYSIYQPTYTLSADFDRFPKPGGVYRWSGGKKQVLPEDSYARYVDEDFQTTATTPQKTRLFGTDTLGTQQVELVPAPRYARNYGYDYYRKLSPLYETTAGTLSSIAANATTVFGNTNTRFMEIRTDGTYWFRVDALGKGQDSLWYKIVSVQNDSQLTLATVFANSAITNSANYTISRSPEMPARLHHAVLYGGLRALTTDQNDPNMMFYQNMYAQAMSDAKKIFVSRPYSQDITGVFEDYRYRR